MSKRAIRKIVVLWLAWLLIIWTYQAAVTARYQVQKPDRVLSWTAGQTDPQSPGSRYLNEPFMNTQVSWDSEFYLAIALEGYDAAGVRTVPPQPNAQPPFDRPLSLSYAFFPVYPYLMRLVALPLRLLSLSPLATLTLAGLLISAIGTLFGMLALTELAGESNSSSSAQLHSAYYLLTFPTSFFLAQVYTEGLFIGLSFSCLALLQRKRWLLASLLATVATLTRAVGVVLLLPLLWNWWLEHKSLSQRQNRQNLRGVLIHLGSLLLLLLPLWVHLLWRNSFWGGAFQIVQTNFFRCQLFNLAAAWDAWWQGLLALGDFGSGGSATAVYYAIEIPAILLGFLSCCLMFKRHPAISAYSLVIILLSVTCGTAWSMSRYLLTVPSLFLYLNCCGQSELFDRIWTLLSILLLALLVTLFSFDLWAG